MADCAILETNRPKFNHQYITEQHIALDGIPHYLKLIPKDKRIPQVVNALCYDKKITKNYLSHTKDYVNHIANCVRYLNK